GPRMRCRTRGPLPGGPQHLLEFIFQVRARVGIVAVGNPADELRYGLPHGLDSSSRWRRDQEAGGVEQNCLGTSERAQIDGGSPDPLSTIFKTCLNHRPTPAQGFET